MPLVSVVLPVFNGQQFLRESVESILGQTFADFECIIVNDGSTDDTSVILESFPDKRIFVVTQKVNMGIVAALNRGLKEASGKYICRMDADDIALPTRIERQVGFLEEHGDIALLGTGTMLIDHEGTIIGQELFPRENHDILKMIFVHNPFVHGTVMVRRAVLEEVGGYNAAFLHNEDYDLWLRIAARHRVANLAEPLGMRRIHETNISIEKETELVGFRVRTLAHAIVKYYRRPLSLRYIVRPMCAYVYRRIMESLKP